MSEISLPLPGRPGPEPRIAVPLPYLSAPVRRFLSREAGSGAVLLAATVLALIWANLPGETYTTFWGTPTALRIGSWGLEMDLQHVVNDAAMAIFFLVVGLEISRELTVGELRDKRTVIVPALGALGGLVLPALVYLAFEHSGPAGSLLAAVLGSLLLRYLGERLPLCTVGESGGPPPLPSGPWRDPTLARPSRAPET